MNYSEIVGVVKERNRPSGGIKTVHEVVKNAFISPKHRLLEIGSNTGFTSVNISLLTGGQVVGIDMVDESIDEARKYAKANGVENKVSFIKASALNLPFENESFDFVWASNVTSFIDDKEKALSEYLRVLKMGGILIIIPIYYFKKPPVSIVNKISNAIGSKIQVWDKNYWLNLVRKMSLDSGLSLELVYESSYRYEDKKKEINNYVEEIFSKKHLQELPEKERDVLKKEYSKFIELFNQNLKYAQYSIFLFQKRSQKDEMELFKTRKIGI
ncbi:MAG: class I SAM-dependent methyltransferase [Candidatus Paceibacterota bacterium]|jgi:ubiquinone/menaquinone biosynthesis C-methylase UbiE